MRRKTWALGFALMAGVSATSGAQAVQACREPDSFSENLVMSLRHAATDMSLDAVVARDTLRLPTTAQVQVVSDRETCGHLARTYSRVVSGNEGMLRTVYAFRVGKVYVVEDPDERDGQYYSGLVLDAELRVLKRYVIREPAGRLAYAHIADKIATMRLQQ